LPPNLLAFRLCTTTSPPPPSRNASVSRYSFVLWPKETAHQFRPLRPCCTTRPLPNAATGAFCFNSKLAHSAAQGNMELSTSPGSLSVRCILISSSLSCLGTSSGPLSSDPLTNFACVSDSPPPTYEPATS
jgi:hypothetical protein